jgi:hypothetical protein
MAVTPDRPGPYAPASVIIELVERHRARGLPSPVNADVLARAGVSDSLVSRTLQALQALDLIGDDGAPTLVLEGLRLAPEADYKARLGEWLRAAYADALQYVDPASDNETTIRDAFRQYQPVGQQPRMVTLFSGLFRHAGIGPEKALSPQARRNKAMLTGKPRVAANATPSPRAPARNGGGNAAAVNESGSPRANGTNQGQHPAIAGVLASLPDPATGWTKTDRDRFLVAFTAVLDFAIPTIAAIKRTVDIGGEHDDASAA